MPVTKFELTEEEPCILSDAIKTSREPSSENFMGIMFQQFVNTCPHDPIETSLGETFRPASTTVTTSEKDWL